MNTAQREEWQFNAILHILSALAKSKDIQKSLIFKGALILNQRLPTQRKSLDIDSNWTADFVKQNPRLEQQIDFLKKFIEKAIIQYFEKQEPVRFELKYIKVERNPQNAHPRGWDGILISVSLLDHEKSGIRGLPPLTIDVAAPEEYSEYSYSEMKLGKSTIHAYTLERFAGEKARAFLTSLPTYREKVGKRAKAIRVRDLYDLAMIIRANPIKNGRFWRIAGSEFKLCCQSRFVDCLGTSSFQEKWQLTKDLYEKSPILPKEIRFKEVESSILSISNYWEKEGIIPFSFPLTTIRTWN